MVSTQVGSQPERAAVRLHRTARDSHELARERIGIRQIINRTIVYATVTVTLGAIYAGSVVTDSLFSGQGRRPTPPSTGGVM